jgi:hypothetical protein
MGKSDTKGLIWLIVLVVIGATLVFLFNKYTQPEFGSESMTFAESLSTTAATYPFIGNCDTQVYYRNNDPRVRKIPSDKRVYFADEKTAKEHNYTRAP